MESVQPEPARIICPQCGLGDLLERQRQANASAARSDERRWFRTGLISLLYLLTLLSALCLIANLFNWSTYDQQDLIVMSQMGLLLCGGPLALLCLALGLVWLKRRMLAVQTVYYCTRDALSFTLSQPIKARYRLLYGVILLPLITCGLTFAVLWLSTRPGATPAPYPGATLVIDPITRTGGSGGTYSLRRSFYTIDQPRALLQHYYEAQFPSFSLPGWTAEERPIMWNTSPTCLHFDGHIKRLFPYQYQYLSVWLCASGEQQTDVHIQDWWND